LAEQTGDLRFALDAYRRFASLFGEIVMGVAHEKFERVLDRFKAQTQGGKTRTSPLITCARSSRQRKQIILTEQSAIPEDPYEQLRVAIWPSSIRGWAAARSTIAASIASLTLWARRQRQAMVFGNMGAGSGTGVAFTRNPSTGKKELYGEYLLNAQGEDVVAGIRTPNPISQLKKELPEVYDQFASIADLLEKHYGDMQDCEFHDRARQALDAANAHRQTQRRGRRAHRCRDGLRKLIDKATAVKRVTPEQLDQLLHPTVDPKTNATCWRRVCRQVRRRAGPGCFQS
jgi:pyruvate,orthophosphate dikinase